MSETYSIIFMTISIIKILFFLYNIDMVFLNFKNTVTVSWELNGIAMIKDINNNNNNKLYQVITNVITESKIRNIQIMKGKEDTLMSISDHN